MPGAGELRFARHFTDGDRRRRQRQLDPEARPHLRGADARHAARVARLDDRLDSASDDRRRSRRHRQALLGRHRISARLDDHDADRRQARRPLRPQDRAPGRARRVPRWLGALRPRERHDRADRLSRAARSRRRRAHGLDTGAHRRRRSAARAWPVQRSDGLGVRRVDRDRAADRRLLRRPSLVELDLLRQSAPRDRGVRRARTRAARSCEPRAAQDRLPRHGAARRRPLVDRALHEPRRQQLSVGLGDDHRARGAGSRADRRLRRRREPRVGARAAAPVVPQPRLQRVERDRLHHRPRALRLRHLSAALSPDRQRARARPLRASSCCR